MIRSSWEGLKESITNRRNGRFKGPETNVLDVLFLGKQEGQCGWSLEMKKNVTRDEVHERSRDYIMKGLEGRSKELGAWLYAGRLH